MTMTKITAGALAASAALALAGGAQAHPKLMVANPAPNATVAPPAEIRLSYSESLIGKFSQIALADAAGHKVPLGPSTVAGGRQLVAPVKAKLAPGRYRVTWRAVSTDTHRVQGGYAFAVK